MIDMEYHQRLGDHRPQARVQRPDRHRARARRAAPAARCCPAPKSWRARRGCFRMALVTADWRDDAIAFYERQGWQNYGAWFVKQLTDDVGPGGEPVRDDN